ncbi:myocardin-related transcription factor B-like isoform X1 [Formica exsecta]|uniref:myocardin-related transcription factor B-like isoform X1 n=1 Tax=Formica exsecta TaxID=72781 RepID=UPI001143BE52|nr:myocardin-related transcription factor B-like isoform X1 [Formica exsecta]
MLRRPINQLVAQGIMPSLKTPPAFHEQRKQLERAKTGDLLKAKIQQRPGRDELVRQHILEDVGHVDPSLAERQRMLKKARLADHLNDQLSHRPGPLELIQKNILHTEEPIERAVKEGHIPFKATCEGQVTKPQHPDHYITFEDDSQSSEGAPSPQLESRSSDVLETAAASAGIVTVSLSIPTTGGAVVVSSTSPVFQQTSTESTIQTFAELCNTVVGTQQQSQQQQIQQAQQHTSTQASQTTNGPSTTLLPLAPAPSPMSLGSTTSSLSPLSNISIASPPAPPPAAITPRPQPSPIAAAAVTTCQRSDAPGKDKNRKKSKTKSQPKTRTIKFHEYKGPPNAQKTPVSSSTSGLGVTQPGETSYELLLQQQQLFLQWQLEWQHKYPQIILPAAQKPLSLTSSGASDAGSVSGSSANAASPAPSNSSNNPLEQPPLRPLGKLEDMKVSDLKVELKRRNLPVSGSKPQLIERLKPFTESSSSNSMSNGPHMTHMGHILMDTPGPMATDESSSQAKSPNCIVKDEPHSPRTASPHSSEHDDPSSPPVRVSGDDIIKVQRRRIEELQRELYRSQQQLQQIRQTQPATVRAEKLVLQQHLQNKMQQQQLQLHLQQLQHLQQQQQQQQNQQQSQQQTQQQATIQQLNAKASLAAFLQAQPNNATAILDSATLTAINNKKNQSKNSTTVQIPTAIVLNLAKPTKLNSSLLGALMAQAQAQQQQQTTTSDDIKPPPPQYDEAAKLLKVKIEPVQKSHIKSQVVDDVLEILIKNGELPPSAAQDPATPTTPNRQLQQNLVFTAPADSPTQSLVFTATSPMSPISPISPIPMEVSQSGCPSPSTPAPPPPPPLPLTAFSIQLPNALQQLQQQEEISSFNTDLLTAEAEMDTTMLLSPQSTQQTSPDPQPPQEVTSSDNANLDLKELGLDLETLDPMDFVQLDCDMPMDMDDPDWLDSLMPQSPTTSTTLSSNHQSTMPLISLSSATDIYDPLLGSNQYSFDLFNMEDSDFKMSSDLSPMTWDKVDFAT